MALAENHRNALKMEAAAVSANNNSANMQVANASSNSTAAQLFVGNSGSNNSTNPNAQHAALIQHHQQQHLSNHSRLSAHHSSIESPNSLIDDEIGIHDEFVVVENKCYKSLRNNYQLNDSNYRRCCFSTKRWKM